MDIIFIHFIMCWLSLQLALESQAESVILSDGNQESVESKKSISSHQSYYPKAPGHLSGSKTILIFFAYTTELSVYVISLSKTFY